MYVQSENLGDLKSFHKKLRKAVHKLFPRELSPTRLLDQYQDKQKKKAKTQAVAAKTLLEQTQAEALATVKRAGEQMASLSSVSPSASLANAGTGAPEASGAGASSLSPVIVVGALGGIAALYFLTRKKS